MVGLTCEALIEYHRATADPRVVPAIQSALDWTSKNCWVPTAGAFKYTNVVAPDGTGGDAPTADLNNLIVDAYSWLGRELGDSTAAGKDYRAKASAIFVGSSNAWLGDGKHVNQFAKGTFDYVGRELEY